MLAPSLRTDSAGFCSSGFRGRSVAELCCYAFVQLSCSWFIPSRKWLEQPMVMICYIQSRMSALSRKPHQTAVKHVQGEHLKGTECMKLHAHVLVLIWHAVSLHACHLPLKATSPNFMKTSYPWSRNPSESCSLAKSKNKLAQNLFPKMIWPVLF